MLSFAGYLFSAKEYVVRFTILAKFAVCRPRDFQMFEERSPTLVSKSSFERPRCFHYWGTW
jgi:hypothetical protein